jgi:hypothetical protein
MLNFLIKKPLFQPLIVCRPEEGHNPRQVLTAAAFIDLLRDEEDYYAGEQHLTRLMITRLRKIFYDRWGWNSELIRGAAHVQSRYQVSIVENPENIGLPTLAAKKLQRYKSGIPAQKFRVVTYRPDDRVYGSSRAGEIPFIYQHDHQEILLPDGSYCDIAHVLAGLDAANHPQVVSPLPGFLSFFDKLFPHVDSNLDIVTWLGDIASSSADFLFAWLRNGSHALKTSILQDYVFRDAPGSDMLGDLDAYVIYKSYPHVSAEYGPRVTDILGDYYLRGIDDQGFRRKRIVLFCKAVGLKDWNGFAFSNEEAWLAYYDKQLRDNTSFQAWSLNEEGIKGILLPLRIWCNGYKKVLKTRILLQIFLSSLKSQLRHESQPPKP